MPNSLTLTFDGQTIAPENRISARTLSHTIPHLQRAIDKIVYFENYGFIRKFSTLPNTLYSQADLYIERFEEGSLRIPFFDNFRVDVIARFREYMTRPYELAAQEEHVDEEADLQAELLALYNQVRQGGVPAQTHQDLINNREARLREWVVAATLKDLNQVLSPLRSSRVANDEIIRFGTADGVRNVDFTFDKGLSKRFGKRIAQKTLGPAAIYTGTLHGLAENHSEMFPILGHFRSQDTTGTMSLLVSDERSKRPLNEHNLTDVPFAIWAAPLATYGTFDNVRGDIVFIDFVR